jgi:hypothetical protein
LWLPFFMAQKMHLGVIVPDIPKGGNGHDDEVNQGLSRPSLKRGGGSENPAPSPPFSQAAAGCEEHVKTRFSRPLLPLLLLLIVPFAAITGCGAPEDEVQNDRDRASVEGIDSSESLVEAGVTAKVRTRLVRDERNSELDLGDIEVKTREGVVILMGAVDREGARTAAEEIARATDGVSNVVNRITVGRGESSAT